MREIERESVSKESEREGTRACVRATTFSKSNNRQGHNVYKTVKALLMFLGALC